MRKLAFSIACLLLSAVLTSGQGRGGGANQTTGQYALRGRLIFSNAKQPQDRIEVTLERNMQRVAVTFTDTLGQFDFLGLPAADYTVSVRVPDYEDVNQLVTVFPTQMNTNVSIQ